MHTLYLFIIRWEVTLHLHSANTLSVPIILLVSRHKYLLTNKVLLDQTGFQMRTSQKSISLNQATGQRGSYSFVWILAEKSIFPMDFDELLLSTEFQSQPLGRNLTCLWSSLIWNNMRQGVLFESQPRKAIRYNPQ